MSGFLRQFAQSVQLLLLQQLAQQLSEQLDAAEDASSRQLADSSGYVDMA